MEKFDEVEKCIPLPGLCGQLRLWELPEHFVFQPLDGRPLLSINRLTGTPSLINEIPLSTNQTSVQTMIVYGVAGAIKLLAGLYILVITGRECVGQYRGHPVFRASSLRFLHCAVRDDLSFQEQKKDEYQYLRLLKIAETTPGLYFSYEVDLTRNIQISHDPSKVQRSQSLWQQADPKFLWNREMLKFLTEANTSTYCMTLFLDDKPRFQSKRILVNDRFITLSLVSRRAVDRIGTRMWRRGADLQGNVANFVETEQMLELDGYQASYVLVRGSIPVLWEQIVDLTYKPVLSTVYPSQTPKVVERHFQDLCEKYGSVLAVDLINQQGLEGVLSVAYKNAMIKLENEKLKYVPFDFHRVCGQIHFDKLSTLHDQIAEQLMQQGFYLVNSERKVVQAQNGVVRTNCIDCLDRVNVTQATRRALEAQLQKIGFFKLQEKIEHHPCLEKHFNHLWADHGDEISIQYTGTPALKGDFVRHGRRTISGFIQDGISALTRYYLNNFKDGARQDAMDLVAGHYVVTRGKPSPFPFGLHEAITCMPLATSLILLLFVCSALSLRRGKLEKDPGQLFNAVVWATLTASIVSAVRLNGRQFCSRPRLCKLIS
ncbi:hypothetical protein SELMODRAFT_110950 [Selaginella moellendorffii]|uniref:SAC domain-containing protein n=1 Tax=Selaginella moellendorffii TaxID=88036 RepID=D8S829_SELML|nr:hypothetical protein SELMODRAFT_110950 [Selaginella moellendorffii]